MLPLGSVRSISGINLTHPRIQCSVFTLKTCNCYLFALLENQTFFLIYGNKVWHYLSFLLHLHFARYCHLKFVSPSETSDLSLSS